TLEANKITQHLHVHLSGVYVLSLLPTFDVLVTSGRDASTRVWGMRTKTQIHVLSGYTGTVADVRCQDLDPQVICSAMGLDLAAGHTITSPFAQSPSTRRGIPSRLF
ncbi:hypothetical protein BGW80DRAFT_1300058, partial [Lactifluus volemus]